jgi:hypothetical protein
MLSFADVNYALEDALVALITSATTGGGALNAVSQYAPIKVVERVAPPEQRLFPNVGVQFRRYEEVATATHQSQISATYDLAIAVSAEYTAGQTSTLAIGRARLRPFVNDGAGNGLVPLLRSQPTLGNLCRRSKVVSVEEASLVTASATSGSVVAALIVFVMEYPVSF